MPITATNLTTSGDNTDLASYATASISPSANKLILAWVNSNASVIPNVPTVSGNGLTWVQVNTVLTGKKCLTLFRAMGSLPSAGSVTFDFGGQTQFGAVWSIVEFGNVDTGGSNGSNAIVQSATNSGNVGTLTVTLGAFENAVNATAGGFSSGASTDTFVVGTGFTKIAGYGQATIAAGIGTEYRTDNSTTVAMTSNNGSATPTVGIAVEIKAPPQTISPAAISSVLTLGNPIGAAYYPPRTPWNGPDTVNATGWTSEVAPNMTPWTVQ